MLKYLKKYWLFTMLAPLFMIGEVSMDLIQPELMSHIIDDGVLGINSGGVGNLDIILGTGIRMVLLVAAGGVCGVMSGVFANLSAQQFGNDVRKDTFKRIMSFSFEQTDKFSTGSLITRVTNDITQLQNFVMQCMRGFVRTSMLFIGGIVCMIGLNIQFGLVIACALPFIVICVIYFIAKSNPKFTILQKKLDKLNNIMQENVSGSRVVKAYVKEDYETERFNKANDELVGTQLDVLLLLSYMTPVMNIILNLSVVAVIKVGGIQVMDGSATPGNVMAAITYCSQVLNAVMRMTMIFQTASRGVASQKRIIEILNCEPAIKDGAYDGETIVKGKVEFRNVSFAYPGNEDASVIEDFNLVISPGETIGILGATGCGKTSLISLIPRFYDVTKGAVLVDDVDVRDYKLEVLRDKIAVSLQKSEIFTASKATAGYKNGDTVKYYDKDGNGIPENALNKYFSSTTNDAGTVSSAVRTDAPLVYAALGNKIDAAAADNSAKQDLTGAITLTHHEGADATSNNQISVNLDAMSAKGLGVNGLKVDGTDDTNAKGAIETIKEAIQKVSTQRSALGAVQNRLEHTINNLDNVVENTTSAESAIRDTDMATEMVKYSNNNILSQAGQAMLAQANQSNQGVLSLLQ